MRRPVVIVLAILLFLFPPYYQQGYFSSDWGWMLITSALPPFAYDIWWLVWIVEFVILAVVNMVWKKGETPLVVDAASLAGGRPAASAAAPAPRVDVAEELVKLNELRKSGALTEEEFAAQKARLLDAPASSGVDAAANPSPAPAASADRGHTVSAAPAAFAPPTAERLAAGDRLVEESDIPVTPAQRKFFARIREWGVPLPMTPWLEAVPSALLKFAGVVGLGSGVVFAVLFSLLAGSSISIFTIIVFGGATAAAIYFILPALGRNLRKKHNLPDWNDLPG